MPDPTRSAVVRSTVRRDPDARREATTKARTALPTPRSRRVATGPQHILSVLAFTIIYAVCFTIIKAGLAYAPPLLYGGLRALIGGAALLGIVFVQRGPFLPDRGSWPALLALALTSTTITFAGMFLSPGRTGAGIASVLGNTQPLFTIVLAALWLNERLTRGKLVALLLGLIGVTLISAPAWTGAGGFSAVGALLALGASGGSAIGSVIVKRMRPRNLMATAGWQLIIGSAPLLVASAAIERGTPVVWSGAFIGMLLFLALVGTSFATALWYWLIERSDVGHLTLFLFFTPVVGLGIAFVVFGERIGTLELIGIGVTIVGIGLTVRDDQRRSSVAPPDQADAHERA